MLPRPEYPRPALVRPDWLNLNGEWQFAFDDDDKGIQQGWQAGRDFEKRINVPFAYQAPLSGIGLRDIHHIIWYRRSFEVPAEWYGRRVFLNFGAADYESTVYVNGKLTIVHRGGHTPFRADITRFLNLDNRNELVVRVRDDESAAQPRGKQSERFESYSIYYTRTSGIWQSVWIEPAGEVAIERIRIDSWDLSGNVTVNILLDSPDPTVRMHGEARFGGNTVARTCGGLVSERNTSSLGRTIRLQLQIPSPKTWSPDEPNLYDLSLRLTRDDRVMDTVDCYFGIRSLHIAGANFLLNGKGLYQRLILDQGYWPDGLMTAPSDEALKADIVLMKEMGFNGCRKHMKVEDPRFLYWADRLGYLVWGEMPACFEYSDSSVGNFTAEWQEALLRDRNHPCIVMWTPINESWGIDSDAICDRPDEIAFLNSLYFLTKSLDPTRPVNGNDGWQNPITDVASIHDYSQRGDSLKAHIAAYIRNPNLTVQPSHGLIQHLPGIPYAGQPIMVTEYGGIGLSVSGQAWGYGNMAHSSSELLERFDALTGSLQQIPDCSGYCYTQLSDVEQECNGLLTYDRKPKIDPISIRMINERRKM